MNSKHIALVELSGSIRENLLQLLPPTRDRTLCQQVTLVYDCGPRFRVPLEPLTIVVYGVVRMPGIEVLACRVAGQDRRPDGRPYFITHSLDHGHRPGEGGRFDPTEVVSLEPLIGYDEITFEGRAVCRRASVL